MSPSRGPFADFDNQPMASEILQEPSRHKRTENNLLADEKGPQDGDPCSCQIIHLC